MDWTEFWRACDTDRLFLELAIAFQVVPAIVGTAWALARRICENVKEDY